MDMDMDMDMIKVGPMGGKTTGGSVWDEKGKGEIAKIFVTMVVLDYPSEFLIEIKGTYYSNGLRSITFVTNKDTYGPYGSARPMTVDGVIDIQIGNDRSFGGFHGLKQKTRIESSGLYLKPITPSMIKPTPLTRPKGRRPINPQFCSITI
ncbi:inactive protein RESTRICTED TEV MOVEMENT 1-like [Solanum stenotomum]|uniref:inactive protein RESTRICTED TEV MOVEMENT 1-like n=1 Tax=Solanum stenotomum TaxID=172797 RepID=UPI0020D13F07|nr:inactive protein RESTRICTED TEV MOVEMENT 1-like [Solanum stenotomum]